MVVFSIFFAVSVFEITNYKLSHQTQRHKPICRPCKRGFVDWYSYNRHMLRKHSGEDEWQCNQCDKKLESISGYRNHMLMHEEDKKEHVCTKCTHRFLYKSQLKRHMESHADGGSLTCASRGCVGKTFQNKDTLKQHMEVHRAEKKECPYEGCDKFFYAAHYLSDHIRRQHKDPYQCENVLSGCDFVMQSRWTLQNHETYFCPYKSGMSDK